MRYFRKFLSQWGTLSRTEKRGNIALFLLVIFIWMIRWIFPLLLPEPASPELRMMTALFEAYTDSVAADPTGKFNPFRKKYTAKTWKIPDTLFNPNDYSMDDWENIGLSPKQATALIQYKNRKGGFTCKHDFSTVFVISETLFALLEPKLLLAETCPEKPFPMRKTAPVFTVNINQCDTESLDALPGIGKTLAERILKFRAALGGFYHTEQLKEVFGLSEETYHNILPYLECDPEGIETISINYASRETLSQHPYLGKKWANNIIQDRNKTGYYKHAPELFSRNILPDSVLQKIVPYLRF